MASILRGKGDFAVFGIAVLLLLARSSDVMRAGKLAGLTLKVHFCDLKHLWAVINKSN